jgi:hypothetical protein
MSMTLILWKAPVVDDPDQAQALLETWYKTGDDSAFEPSDDLAAVYGQLLELYPMDWEKGADPWADGPDNSGRLLVLSLRWGGDSRILADIPVLAKKHELILYDPQGPDVFLPSDPLEPGPIPKPTAWEWFKTFAIPVVLIGLTYAAWQIPIGWIRWPAVIVAGFIAAAGLFVLYLMIAAALGFIDADERPATCKDDARPL